MKTLLISLAAVLLVSERVPIPSQASFELKATTEIKHDGIRAYAETRYVYSEVRDNVRRELWSLSRREKYLRHWISPTGRVWVFTAGMPGPGGASAIWTRDTSANGFGPWGFSNVLPPRVQAGERYARQSADDLDLDRVEAKDLGRSTRSEELRMPLKDGGESRITLVAQRDAMPVLLVRTLAKGERDLVTEALETDIHEELRLSRPVPRSPLILWEYRDPTSNRMRRILQSVGQSTYGESLAGVLLPVRSEREIDLEPSATIRTPAGRVIWFGFSQPGEPNAARMTIMSYDGSVIDDVDLLKLYGYRDAAEARRRLVYRDVLFRDGRSGDGEDWEPIDENQNASSAVGEFLELRDDEGRLLVRLNAQGARIERLKGLTAKRPKESTWVGENAIGERTFASPDGRFHLRERHLKSKDGRDPYVATLIGQAIDEDGKRVEVQLWSDFHYDPLAQARLTNSGRSFVLRFDHSTGPNGKDVVVSALFVRNADGRQLAGMTTVGKDGWFATVEEARKGILLDKMTVTSEGLLQTRVVDDVTVQVPSVEKIALPFKDGRVMHMNVGKLRDGMNEGVYWFGRQPTTPK